MRDLAHQHCGYDSAIVLWSLVPETARIGMLTSHPELCMSQSDHSLSTTATLFLEYRHYRFARRLTTSTC